jgi:hypothetical protein
MVAMAVTTVYKYSGRVSGCNSTANSQFFQLHGAYSFHKASVIALCHYFKCPHLLVFSCKFYTKPMCHLIPTFVTGEAVMSLWLMYGN